ncbi:MmgE/PrpD family protein [Chloroflexota bacterium]
MENRQAEEEKMVENRIAKFIIETDIKSLPAEAITTAKRAFLDYIGVTVAASQEPIGKIVTQYVREGRTQTGASVIAGGFKASAPEAAFANGVMGHGLDYDDVSLFWHGHPSVTIVPVVLSLGQIHGISGKQAIEAYVMGCELEYRIGAQTGSDLLDRGYHPTAIIGNIGATAAACKILKLDAERAKMALGIAASEAGGLRINFGTMTKPFHAGNAAKNGIVAALLAKGGFTSSKNALGGMLGFLKTFGGGEYDMEKMTGGLGKDYLMLSEGLGFKPYPSCGGTHNTIDAALYLREKHRITPKEVTEIDCATTPLLSSVLLYHLPRRGFEGKFSLEYCAARALVSGEVRLKHFTDEQVSEPEIQKLIAKVKYVHPEELLGVKDTHSAEGEEVTVRLKSGQSFSRRVAKPKGDPTNPLTDDELIAKYEECASLRLSPEAVKRSEELLLGLEEVKNINELVDLLN